MNQPLFLVLSLEDITMITRAPGDSEESEKRRFFRPVYPDVKEE